MEGTGAPPGVNPRRELSGGGLASPESTASAETEPASDTETCTAVESASYLDRAKQTDIHRQMASKLCGIIGSVAMSEKIPDFNSMSESFVSYSNLGRSLIGSAVGLGDYYDEEDREMEWREPWVEVDASDFRTRLAGSPIVNDNRYFEKGSNLQLLAGEEIVDKVSAYSLG